MWLLSTIFGVLVGISLGLTGGGGAIFAVPLLVYGLGIQPREAVVISLVAVGMTSMVGFLSRWKAGEVETRTGGMFAIAGMLGAPLGTWIAGRLPEMLLLLAFAGLMVVVAIRLWLKASRSIVKAESCIDDLETRDGPACRRDAVGVLILNSRCAILLVIVGVFSGALAGLFGVGGGFIIVPALVLFSGMAIHRAVGTSLMVIALVSISGVVSQAWAGRVIPLFVTFFFVFGGIVGLLLGQRAGRRMTGPTLQRVFAVAILGVAVFVVYRNISG